MVTAATERTNVSKIIVQIERKLESSILKIASRQLIERRVFSLFLYLSLVTIELLAISSNTESCCNVATGWIDRTRLDNQKMREQRNQEKKEKKLATRCDIFRTRRLMQLAPNVRGEEWTKASERKRGSERSMNQQSFNQLKPLQWWNEYDY